MKTKGPINLSKKQKRIALALTRAIVPDGMRFSGDSERTVRELPRAVRLFSPTGGLAFGPLLDLLEHAAIPRMRRRFSQLTTDQQERLIRDWEGDPIMRLPLFLMATLIKTVHYDLPEIYEQLDCVFDKSGAVEPERWLQQIISGADVTDGEEIECDVVVVGTGAGGAVVGQALADRGHAVVYIEEGMLARRDLFSGRTIDIQEKLYRRQIYAAGNSFLPILIGCSVGGSTTINTGTCFRTPKWILDAWCDELETDELSPEQLEPHFARVERMVGVETANEKYLGGAAKMVARGCDALGWHHYPLKRNAPDCDGQGTCNYGCPTDAKRSTNLAFIPAALTRGAMLYSGLKAEQVIIENGRAAGISARSKINDAILRVRAKKVVLACGAVYTPAFLLRQGIANSSGRVGTNLSMHPATGLSALFDEPINQYNAIPQGYACDTFHHSGILLLGASAPINVAGLMFTFNGRRLTEAMESYDRIASFGAMIEDESRGRVRVGPDGRPIVTYWLKQPDVERLHLGLIHVADIFRAAGAKKFYPLTPRFPILDGRSELESFRRERLNARDILQTSFHPIGTTPMGRDPKTSVINVNHETHDLPNLYIVDASAVPGPPAVNPQITIMTMADRAAAKIDETL